MVSIAGRVMAKRGPFLVIQETSGRIQAYASKEVQQELKDKYQGLDIGDIIGVQGACTNPVKAICTSTWSNSNC